MNTPNDNGMYTIELTYEELKLLEGVLELEISKWDDWSDPTYALLCDIQKKVTSTE